MKSLLYLFLAAFAGMAFRSTADPLPIGSPIPAAGVKMKDVSGKILSLHDVKTTQGLLVMFSCNTCPYVMKNQERTIQTGTYAGEKNIGFIVVNSNEGSRPGDESYKAMQAYARAQGYQWPYSVDSNNELADAFGASRTPEVFLFDAKGRLVYRGAIDDSPADPSKVTRQHLKMAMDEMLSGKAVSVTESRSVGCGIKRKV
ncbi:MAG: thioredoxin family protein [Flavihumibacter sp.]